MSTEGSRADEGFVLALPSEASRPVEHLMWGLVLGLLACVPYFARSFDANSEFIWDDDRHIVHNKAIQSPEGFWNIWRLPGPHEAYTALAHPPQYYPLTHTTYWIEYRFFGLNPTGYRIDNAILHALSAVLLWLVLKKLAVPGAWMGAAIFAVHPINAESVAWITERKNVLSLVLSLGAVWGYLKFMEMGEKKHEGEERGAWGFYALALVLFVAAMLSKTIACCVPAVLMVIAWWKRRGVGRHLLLLVPFFVSGLVLSLHTAWLERVRIGAVGPDWELTIGPRILVAAHAIWFYVGKVLWPHPLIFTYPRWHVEQPTAMDMAYLVATAIVVAGLALAALAGRRLRGVAAGAAIYLIALVPAMGFFNVFPMRYSFVADHFAYFAVVPLAAGLAAAMWLAVASAIKQTAARTYAASIGGTVILVAMLVVLVKFQLPKYRSNFDLWTHTLAYNDEAWMAHTNKAGQLLQLAQVDLGHEQLVPAMGEARAAEHHFRRALVLRPGHINALIGLSATHLCMAATVDAMETSVRAHQAVGATTNPAVPASSRPATRPALPLPEPTPVPPGVPTAAELRSSATAEAMEAVRLAEEAAKSGRGAASVSPVAARLQFARALRAQGRYERAMVQFALAAKDDPSPGIRVEMARTLWQLGDFGGATRAVEQVLHDFPRSIEANAFRGEIHIMRGELEKAFDRFGRIIQLDPENVDAYVQRGFLWMEKNRPQEAAKVIERALALDPQHPGARKAAMMIYQAISTRATTRVATTRPATTRPATTAPATSPTTPRGGRAGE